MAALTVPFTNFELPAEILVLGAIAGLTYGLLAVGLTLVYKVSRVLNFAHGALGALPSMLLAVLALEAGLNYWVALLLALVAGAAAGALVEIVVIRRLRNASRLVAMVATIAAAQVLAVFYILLPHDDDFLADGYPTPFRTTVVLGNLRLGPGDLMILVIAPALAVGLTMFFRYTRLGLAARAAADNADAALMAGVPVKLASSVIWGIAGLFAAASAILVSSTGSLGSAAGAGVDPSLLVRGLAAAMIGGMVSLPLAFAGGIAIGMGEIVLQWNYPTAGLSNPLMFAVILVCLLVRRGLGTGLRDMAASSWALTGNLRRVPRHLAEHPRVRWARRIGLFTLIGGTALLAQVLPPSQRVLLSSVLLFAVMGLSLVVLTGFAGQISLGQYAFVTLGAIIGGRMTQIGFPSGSALVYAVVGCGIAAALISLPALRVRGLFLAVATLAFALAAEGWLFRQDWLVKSSLSDSTTSLVVSRPHWFGISFEPEVRYSWLCLALLVVTAAGVHHLRSTGIGRAMLAVRANEPAASAMSLSPRRVKLIAFVLSGMIAGVAGYFYGALLVNFSASIPDTAGRSLTLVVMVILGGATSVTGAILGALWIQGIPYVFGDTVGLLSSALGVLVVLLVWPGGLASFGFRLRDLAVSVLTGEATSASDNPDGPATVPPPGPIPTPAPAPARHRDQRLEV
jgi:branched-subunit amino acid ABC-type transport system permease component